MAKTHFRGLLVPVVTPFKPDFSVDTDAFVDICKWLLASGANGLAVLGTTSEANSLSVQERMDLVDALVDAGVDPSVLMPGVGCCSMTDTIALTRHAVSRGCGGVLMLPPFYYKPVSDDGLFAAFDTVIQAVGSSDLGVWLYHIPPMAQVGLSHDLIERLITAHPDTVLGIKDSSGQWDNMEAMLKRFPGFGVFPGSESFTLQAARLGGVGCISASGNINPAGIRALIDGLDADEADSLQAKATQVRKIFQAHPLIPAAKGLMAKSLGRPDLATVRPPLLPYAADKVDALEAELKAVGWSMPAWG